jgi:hypothetical protein
VSAHTPGPWETGTAATTSVWAGGEQIASCDWSLECPNCGANEPDRRAGREAFNPREVREANARLIAAAPELLRACKLVAAMAVAWAPLTPGDIAEVNAAIAKAEARP